MIVSVGRDCQVRVSLANQLLSNEENILYLLDLHNPYQPVPEVNSPEAVITAHGPEHLVVSSLHPKCIVVKEDFLQCCGVLHTTKVDPC